MKGWYEYIEKLSLYLFNQETMNGGCQIEMGLESLIEQI